MAWTCRDIPDQSGRIAVVTGANSGIGEPTAYSLEEISSQFCISREGVRQIERKAMRKLRYNKRRTVLQFFAR